jgi:hypothetical protein
VKFVTVLSSFRKASAGKIWKVKRDLFAVILCESVPEAAGDHYAKIKLTRQQKGLVLDEK